MQMRIIKFSIALILLGMVIGAAWAWFNFDRTNKLVRQNEFVAKRAMADLEYQVALGPRVPGSAAHTRIADWVEDELDDFGWEILIQEGDFQGKPVRNVIAKRGSGSPWIVLGAHYDTRLLADRDPDLDKRSSPGPGANDGASGVAVLMELGRVLPDDLPKNIWLVFFDVEDNGGIGDWDWVLGSRYFVQNLTDKPDLAVIVDMIGDSDLQLYQEINSDDPLTEQIWLQAQQLGYTQFIPVPKHRILDDHVPFLEAGIPAVDIIDINYKYWHTAEDTPDKTALSSLDAVGSTLLAWLLQPYVR